MALLFFFEVLLGWVGHCDETWREQIDDVIVAVRYGGSSCVDIESHSANIIKFLD